MNILLDKIINIKKNILESFLDVTKKRQSNAIN